MGTNYNRDAISRRHSTEFPLLPSFNLQPRRSSIAKYLLGSFSRSISEDQTTSSKVAKSESARIMGRVMRILVVGPKKVGKTAILHQLALLIDITKEPYQATIDDTYSMQMDGGDKPKELVVFHDTAGIADQGEVALDKPYIQVADAFILVYSVDDGESFKRVDLLKKFLDGQFGREKKEVPIVVLANKIDCSIRVISTDFAINWAQRERVKLFEVTATDRQTLIEPLIFLASRHFHPPKESKFSLTKKLKPEKSGVAIVMDI